jgi:hypothetical protein
MVCGSNRELRVPVFSFDSLRLPYPRVFVPGGTDIVLINYVIYYVHVSK